MEINVIPYNSKYREGVVSVLKYLWNENEEYRSSRFDWLYGSNSNPSFNETLAVIAINELDEVVGFRGWVPGIVWIRDSKFVVVRAADVVVSPRARRLGIFSKMTSYSLKYLKDKGVDAIINLSSNRMSNPGYIKLGWETVEKINIWYRPNFFNATRHLDDNGVRLNENEYTIEITPYIPNGLMVKSRGNLCFSLGEGQLDWYARRPDKNYIVALARDADGKILSFFIFNTSQSKASLEYLYYSEFTVAKNVFRLASRYVGSKFIAAWGWALSEESLFFLKRIGFFKIPFYQYLKKKPPILVRTLKPLSDDSAWTLGHKDIRIVQNWNINLLDDF